MTTAVAPATTQQTPNGSTKAPAGRPLTIQVFDPVEGRIIDGIDLTVLAGEAETLSLDLAKTASAHGGRYVRKVDRFANGEQPRPVADLGPISVLVGNEIDADYGEGEVSAATLAEITGLLSNYTAGFCDALRVLLEGGEDGIRSDSLSQSRNAEIVGIVRALADFGDEYVRGVGKRLVLDRIAGLTNATPSTPNDADATDAEPATPSDAEASDADVADTDALDDDGYERPNPADITSVTDMLELLPASYVLALRRLLAEKFPPDQRRGDDVKLLMDHQDELDPDRVRAAVNGLLCEAPVPETDAPADTPPATDQPGQTYATADLTAARK